MADYQALIMAVKMGIQDLDVCGDSQLVISQLLGEYEVKKEDLIPYHKHASRLLEKFYIVKLSHVPRSSNKMVDALAGFAATLALGAEETMYVPVCNRWVVAPKEYEVEYDEVEEVDMIIVYQIDKEDWRQPIIDYLDHQKLPNDPRHRTKFRRRASCFILFNGTLYRRSFNELWSRCIEDEEVAKTIEEFHSGICGAHQSGPKLHDRIKRAGYGIPQRIVTNNGKPFVNNLMDSLCQKFKFTQHKLSMYNAPANGLAEAFNKTLCSLLSKVVVKSKCDWHEKIGEALLAYMTTYKNATQPTPYSLVYGVEVVLPLEVQIPSLRIAIQ
uniref:Integrase catalytic domain-containing protein n=1 Tax=Chenopodium quinoa TaxID=63459 RepID=A0A803LR38_CHEQI